MRVAQVAPLFESVPPRGYGGTERVVSFLTEELVRQGHEVTLFASGDSITRARLVAPCARALRGESGFDAPHVYYALLLEQLLQRADEFDVVHFHCDALHFPVARRLEVPHVTTLHGRLDLAAVAALFDVFAAEPVISISASQRAPLPGLRWLATIHHGVPVDRYRIVPRSEPPYLAFLGRMSPEKGVDRAIAIAGQAGVPLRIAAKVDPTERTYFERHVAPLLGRPGVVFVGEIGELEKQRFLGNALALLFPIDWPEPFGIVMIEAMACGTPVIAVPRGAVPEVVEDGVSGFLVETVDEAARAAGRIGQLSRRACRAVFERRFTAARMAADYLAAYERLILARDTAAAGPGDREPKRVA